MPTIPIYFQRQSEMSPRPQTPNDHEESSTPPKPRLRIHLDDLDHEAIEAFTSAVNLPSLLRDANEIVLKELYNFQTTSTDPKITGQSSKDSAKEQPESSKEIRAAPPQATPTPIPNTTPNTPAAHQTSQASTSLPSLGSAWPEIRSITLVLRPMPGVAYTTSLSLDEAHKEIHLSLNYLSQIHSQPSPSDLHASKSSDTSRLGQEIHGAVVHETVHVWQAYADGTAPVGLTEGIADWVRLRAGLAPPHWKREGPKEGHSWDDGYETTGYFLEWLEEVWGGRGTVGRINEVLRRGGAYEEGAFWVGLFGVEVEVLWREYGKWLEKQKAG